MTWNPAEWKPGEVHEMAGGLFVVCNNCRSLVRIDKPLFGDLHVCIESEMKAARKAQEPEWDHADVYDRRNWPNGPWNGEPNRVEFISEGLPCVVLRGPVGAWCGYVGVGKDHPLYEKPYNATIPVPQTTVERTVKVDDIGVINLFCAATKGTPEYGIDGFMEIELVLALSVHGGITYAEKAGGVIVNPAGPDNYYFGFDCGHAGDIAPSMVRFYERVGLSPDRESVYRDLPYAIHETERLAAQLAAASLWPRGGVTYTCQECGDISGTPRSLDFHREMRHKIIPPGGGFAERMNKAVEDLKNGRGDE